MRLAGADPALSDAGVRCFPVGAVRGTESQGLLCTVVAGEAVQSTAPQWGPHSGVCWFALEIYLRPCFSLIVF